MHQETQQEQLPKVEVRNSEIHGRGVYALEDIKQGQRIIEYVGEKITSEEGTRRSKLHPELTYIFILNDQYDIDGSVGGNGSQYINHSCEGNSEIDIKDDRIWILASKDIKAGEEILYDYSFEPDDDLVECRCGSAKCRGYLNEFDNEEQKAKALEDHKKKQEQHIGSPAHTNL